MKFTTAFACMAAAVFADEAAPAPAPVMATSVPQFGARANTLFGARPFYGYGARNVYSPYRSVVRAPVAPRAPVAAPVKNDKLFDSYMLWTLLDGEDDLKDNNDFLSYALLGNNFGGETSTNKLAMYNLVDDNKSFRNDVADETKELALEQAVQAMGLPLKAADLGLAMGNNQNFAARYFMHKLVDDIFEDIIDGNGDNFIDYVLRYSIDEVLDDLVDSAAEDIVGGEGFANNLFLYDILDDRSEDSRDFINDVIDEAKDLTLEAAAEAIDFPNFGEGANNAIMYELLTSQDSDDILAFTGSSDIDIVFSTAIDEFVEDIVDETAETIAAQFNVAP